MQGSVENNYKLRALKRSIITISSAVLVEASLGLIVGSLAILSDGLHALLDALTTFALFVATRASLKPPDEEHMYGHEKFESIGGLVGGILLIGVSITIMIEAFLKIVAGKPYINFGLGFAGFIAIGYTFCMDFFRVGTFRKARVSGSPTMKAGLYHAIADLSSTLIALFGFGLTTLGFYYGDSIASIVLSILLNYLSVKLILSSGMELSDAISKDVAQRVRGEILGTQGVYKCENLRVRRAGAKTFVEAIVKVPDMSLEEAHALTSRIEANIKRFLRNAEITIHIEPLKPEMQTEKLIEKFAMEVEGVKETHKVNVVRMSGKLYVTLHARVDPKLSVQEAHEIAQKIENKISERISTVENVSVHIEPFNTKIQKGAEVDENEIRKIIHKTVDGEHTVQIKRIFTYVANEKRYINIDCNFTKEISIEKAHQIASQIEDIIKKKFSETVVTVHMEPALHS
ncbi:MAG: cation-efflux pump [Candidatus Bathyarchaeia archaeon]